MVVVLSDLLKRLGVRINGKEQFKTITVPKGKTTPFIDGRGSLGDDHRDIEIIGVIGQENPSAKIIRSFPIGFSIGNLGLFVQKDHPGRGPLHQMSIDPHGNEGLINGQGEGLTGAKSGMKGKKKGQENPRSKIFSGS
jgi:hypothetical protein